MLDHRLQTFLTVAETQNFTKAAEQLNLTQPAVSQQIKSLENQYHITLIKKKAKPFALTAEGNILLHYAQKMLSLSKKLAEDLNNSQEQEQIHSLGATMTIGDYVLPYLIKKHKDLYPQIDLLLQVNNTEEILEKLLTYKIELALVEGSFPKNIFCFQPFKNDELVLAASPEHPFAQKKTVSIDELLQGKLILREKGSGTRDIFEKQVQAYDYHLHYFHPYMEIGSINAIKSLVEANLGYTVISKEAIKKEIAQQTLVIIPINDIQIRRQFTFIYLPENKNKFIDNFITFCQKSK